jgi:SAM-dependent methyltransferase
MQNLYSAMWFESFLDTIQPAQTELEIAFIARHLPQPAYTAVLDVCCGQGRHARLLAARRYRVTGVDFNRAALDKARRDSNGQVTYIERDMRRLTDLPGSFDAVVNLWQSFGYFDEAANADILRQIGQKLNHAGRLILDIYHRGFFEQHQGSRSFERQGRTVVETKVMNGRRLTVRSDYSDSALSDVFDWQLYTPDEICLQAGQFGFGPLVICTEFEETKPASADSPRMQFVFEKTGK